MKLLREYIREILNEAKFEAETTELTRKAMKYIKSTILPYIKYELKDPSNPNKPMPMRPIKFSGNQLPRSLWKKLLLNEKINSKLYIRSVHAKIQFLDSPKMVYTYECYSTKCFHIV